MARKELQLTVGGGSKICGDLYQNCTIWDNPGYNIMPWQRKAIEKKIVDGNKIRGRPFNHQLAHPNTGYIEWVIGNYPSKIIIGLSDYCKLAGTILIELLISNFRAVSISLVFLNKFLLSSKDLKVTK